MIPSQKEMEQAFCLRHGQKLQEKFSKAVVAVCGLGGLGSNIAIALARAGIGKLILIDFDKVDISNLHRQQYKTAQIGMDKTNALAGNLKEIAPYVEVETHTQKITTENAVTLLQKADVICEAFDNPKEKSMLVDVVFENMPEKYFIGASGMAGLEPADTIQTKKITEHFYICGDGVSDVENHALFSTRVMLCAAHQAHQVLRILAEKEIR